jgi:Flp pilus assembly protein TadG
MKTYKKFLSIIKGQKGAVAVIVALLLPVLFGVAALAVDIGYAVATKSELQNVADAAALAAVNQLGRDYLALPPAQQKTYVADSSAIVTVVNEIASKNLAAGINMSINAGDIVIGKWDKDTHTLTSTLNQPNAVSIVARRDGSANGPITAIFAKLFGVQTLGVSARATAALNLLGRVGPGEIGMPVGISSQWFAQPSFCDQPIKFYPTGTLEGCAGWHTFDNAPASASKLESILRGLKRGTFESPEIIAGETQVAFIGGSIAAAFSYMKDLYDAKKNPATGEWETTVLVYEQNSCANPNGWFTVAGFARAIVTDVQGCPTKTIQAKVICDSFETGRGGGGNYGLTGSIAGLVK